VTCTIRRSRGEDIAAACGQLAGQVRKQQATKDAKNVKKGKK
jgi:adenine C2-methylase RlmN of 23S rRNA A2503 and tRNA A37